MWRLARAAAMVHPSPPRSSGTRNAASTVPVDANVGGSLTGNKCGRDGFFQPPRFPAPKRTKYGAHAPDEKGPEQPPRLRQHLA